MVKKKMDRSEALKIFNIEAAETEIDPEKVMEVIFLFYNSLLKKCI